MTTEIDDFISDSDIFSYADWALQSGIWNGRQVSWTEASEFCNEVQSRMLELLFESQNTALFDRWTSQFARIGSSGSRELIARDIQALDFSKNDLILQAGLGKSLSKFWKQHKKEILIGTGVLAIVTAIAVVAVTTGGAATGGAIAAGGAALDALKKNDRKPDPHKNAKNDRAALQQQPSAPSQSTLAPSEIATPPKATESACRNKVIFGEKGILLDGEYSSYKDILNSQGGQPFPKFSHPSFSIPNQFPYQPGLSGNHTPPNLTPFRQGSTKPDSQRFPPLRGTEQSKSWIANAFETIGRGMIDLELMNPEIPPLPEREVSFRFSTLGNREPHLQIAGINGINTNQDQARSHANYISSLVPKRCVDWVYNRGRGPVIDLAEVFTLNYAGFSPNTGQLLQENWLAFHEKNADRPNAKYLQFCHSQGAIHVRNALANLPKEIRDRITVVAIAPAAVVPRELCHESFNYASKKDVVHLGELIYRSALDSNECGISKLLEMTLDHYEQLILLDPHPDAEGIDHDFQSPTFENVIRFALKNYLNNNGQ
jgi:hypothetical protein